eukprot:759232-Hanusia_phi.AAC.1
MSTSSSLPRTVLFWLLKNWFLPTLLLLVGRPDIVLSYTNVLIVFVMDVCQTYGYKFILLFLMATGVFIKYIMPPALGIFISFLARRFFKVSVGSMAFLRLRKVAFQEPFPFFQPEDGSTLYFEEIVLSTKFFQAKESRKKKYFAIILRGIELRGTVNMSALAKRSKQGKSAKAPLMEENRSGGMIHDIKQLVIGILKPLLSRFIAWILASWVELIVIDANVVLLVPGMDSMVVSMKELTLFSEDGPDRRMSIELITEKISIWHEEKVEKRRRANHLDAIEEADGASLSLKAGGNKRVRSSTFGMLTNLHRSWETADEKQSTKTRLLLVNSFAVNAQCSITISSASVKCVSVFVGQTFLSFDSDVVLRMMNTFENWKAMSHSRMEREDSVQAGSLEAEVPAQVKYPHSPARLGFESLMKRSGRGQHEESSSKRIGARLASRARQSLFESVNSPEILRKSTSAVSRTLFRSNSMGLQAEMSGPGKLSSLAEQKKGGQVSERDVRAVYRRDDSTEDFSGDGGQQVEAEVAPASGLRVVQSSKLDRGMMNDNVMLKMELSSHDEETTSELRIDRELLLGDAGEAGPGEDGRGGREREQLDRVHQLQFVLSDPLRLQMSESCNNETLHSLQISGGSCEPCLGWEGFGGA